MTHAIHHLALSALSAALLTGCAASSDQYPSLAVRDAERQTGQFTPAAPATTQTGAQTGASTTAPETFAQLRGFVERARTAHQQFVAEQPEASRLFSAARGLTTQDDRRARALVAVAGLTSLHGQTTLALSDLDQLEFAAATAFETTDDIKAAQILVGQMIRDQDAALDSLSGRMTQ